MRRPRRILFCIFAHHFHGGIEIWQKRMLRVFRDAGWEASLGLPLGTRFNVPQRFVEEMNEPSAVVFDGRTGTDEGRIRAVMKGVRDWNPDVVMATALGHVLPAVGRLKAAGRRVRLVYPMHALSNPTLGEALTFDPVIDLALCTNPLQSSFLRNEGFSGMLTDIPNGTDHYEGGRIAASPSMPLRLVFIGRFHQASKRILDAVSLAESLERRGVDYRVTMVGDGPDANLLRSAINASGLERRFELTGWLTQKEIHADILARSDVLLLFSPLQGETSPLVFAEALSHGVLPVSTRFVGLRSLPWFREGQTAVTYDVGDIVALSEVLEHFASDRAALARLSASCADAGKTLTWESIEQRALTSVEAVLADPGQRPWRNFLLGRPSTPAGRLDRFLPPVASEALRRALRRFPRFDDGWGEWPGTLTDLSPEQDARIAETLARLDGQQASRS